jgi:CRP-like cAMP-binding protein
LFSGLSRSEREAIQRVTYERTVTAGEILCEQGQPGYQFFLILEGEASVHQSGRELRRLSPGDHVGELALLDRGLRSATVRAETDMVLQVIDEMDFSTLLDEVPGLAHKLLAVVANLLRTAEARNLA